MCFSGECWQFAVEIFWHRIYLFWLTATQCNINRSERQKYFKTICRCRAQTGTIKWSTARSYTMARSCTRVIQQAMLEPDKNSQEDKRFALRLNLNIVAAKWIKSIKTVSRADNCTRYQNVSICFYNIKTHQPQLVYLFIYWGEALSTIYREDCQQAYIKPTTWAFLLRSTI